MANAVQIILTVDNSQAIPSIEQLGNALSALGVKGEIALKKVGDGMNAIGAPAVRWSQTITGHSTTSLDAVRLLSQEFGLRLPRAMEAMLSRMPQVTSAISGMIGLMAGIAGFEVFAHVAEQAVHFAAKIFDVNAAMREYLATSGKAASQRLFDESSLETSIGLLKQANAEVTQLEQRRVAAGADKPAGGFMQYALRSGQMSANVLGGGTALVDAERQGMPPTFSADDGIRLAKASERQALADARTHQQQRDNQMEELKARLAGLAGRATAGGRPGVERSNTRQIDALEAANQHASELDLQRVAQAAHDRQIREGMDPNSLGLTKVPTVSADAGKGQQRIKDLQADEDYAGKTTALGRETSMTLMKLDHERIEAALSGEELYHQKLMDDLAESKLRLTNAGQTGLIGPSAATLTEKYANDESERLVKRQNDTAEARARMRDRGLTGAARAYADRDTEVGRNNSNPELVRAGTTGDANLAAQQELDQKLQALDEAFTEHAKQLADQRTAEQLGGYAKIDAEAARQIAELQKKYDEAYKDQAGNDHASLAAAQQLAAAKAAVQSDAASKAGELTARRHAEDLQYDKEAADAERRVKEDGALGWVAAYRNGIAEIQAQEAERIAKLQEDAAKEGLTGDEVARRKVDIDRTANAEIAQQNQQLQHTIAGNLQAAFTDPVDFIKSRMEQMFFEIVAAWIMRMQVFKQLFGSTMGGLTPGGAGAPGGGAGGILGAVGQAVHGVAAPGAPGSPASANPLAGMSGTRGYVNGSPDISSIYRNIPGGGTNTFPGNPTVSGGASGAGTGPYDGPDGTDSGLSATIPSIPAPSGGGFPGSGASSSADAAGTLAGVGMAGYMGEQSTVKAFETGDPLGGALGDAAAGAAIGMLAGPEGALIGAAIGAGVGLAAGTLGWATGEAGNIGARTWYAQNTRQQLEADEQQTGGGDFQTQISAANKTAADGLAYMRIHFGASSADWVWTNYMRAELHKVTSEIAATAMGGRFAAASSGAQFHTGGDITGFGSYATSATEGWIHAMMGETVMNTAAVGAHGPMLRAMNAGASATDIAAAYLAGSGGGPSGGGATYNGGDLHVHTLDTKTMAGWLRDGGAQLIKKHTNDYASRYAGDGISG